MEEEYEGAFVQRFELKPPTSPADPPLLPLQGLTFAVKDIFDVSGHVTGFGNPDWARTHEPAKSTAPAVAALLEAGATCLGKTVMDELAYSINGENFHYGTPPNPVAPGRVPGGSSSGSAVAVAAGLVDFSLGTDTGGSVRVPAAYCGIFGIRPSHGAVSSSGVIPMAESFDTVGWFARDPSTLALVARVLLPSPIEAMQQPTHVIIPEDCFQLLVSPSDQLSQILISSLENMYGCDRIKRQNLGNYVYNEVPSSRTIISKLSESQASTIPALGAVSYAMRSIQRFEFKENHGEWINTTKPKFGPGISERIAEAVNATDENIECYRTLKSELQVALTALLENYGVLAIPTLPGPPPKVNTEAVTLENFRAKAFCLLSIAGMSGFCQVTVPPVLHDIIIFHYFTGYDSTWYA
ncbi:amidase 1 isoform X2 [Asparagus officinalis]|uniref:amidase 1 isoform X2 n=1 Tax=Asparagus officinalis TaxID=4686 RepID=UPI00098E8189|nr:amidase 1 isoform X2 [Asparagus officinalis]